MELYKKKIKARIFMFCTVLLIFAGILLYNQFAASAALKESVAFSFQCGFSAAGALVIAFWIFKYRRALSDEAKLRVLMNQENDERMKAIRAKAGMPMLWILSMILVLAGMISGYFNETVFITLICAALFQLMVCLFFKLYFMKKM
jgi:divalent metal cation (Fe/Co/Zn/Cd) transporter